MNGWEGRTQNDPDRQQSTISGIVKLLAVVCLCLGTNAARASENSHSLRTITTAQEAHNLAASEAVRGYPIHLKGVVTFYDPYLDSRQVILFVHDASGSMFVRIAPRTVLDTPAGSLVDVQGVSGMGDFAPIITHPQVTLVGRAQLPPTAPQVSLNQLLTGAEDGQWVEVEGVIHSIFETEHDILMHVAVRDGLISTTVPREPGRNYQDLVDAKVRIRANAGPLFNGDGQMIGARLLMPNLSALEIIEAGPGDALHLPTSSIGGLSRYTTASALPRRIHVRGRVTLAWLGSLLCIRDATHGLCAHSTQMTPLAIGDMVDIAGFAEVTNSVPSLSDAVFRKSMEAAPAGLKPLSATPVSADEALHGKHDAELIQLEGQLVGRDLVASDTTLMLASDGAMYAVLLPKNMANAASDAWKDGSRLRITGICSVELDAQRSEREGGPAVRKSFRLLLRSASDVEVLQRPSWWTPTHTLVVLTVVLLITLLVLGWVVVLSRRLKLQTSASQMSEEQFRHMAQHDYLTGLPTRLLLRDRLDMALEKSRRSKTSLALLMLDLDNFKQINDTLGHGAGDQALKISAKRIVDSMRRSDTAARISGDEFIVLITDLVDPHEAELVAAKVVSALSAPFRVGDRDVPLSASVGICVSSGGGLGADALLKRADIAMYHAKARGRNRFESYTVDMARATEENLLLQAGLRRALQANEFEVYYQPMVSFRTGELTGFEALVRWRSKQMGMIMPEEFISVAEKTGLIGPLGEWVLRQSCREIGILERQMGRNFVLAVNLSPRQFEQADLPTVIERVLTEAGRAPHLIEFEITENMLMKDSAMTYETLLKLRQLGVRLAIDDFGIGFSSLSYITKFSIDRIKIDRSFISKCTREGGNLAVVRAMVAMAHGLSMQVVAEGVETAAEFRFLRDEGCDTAQGFYLSRPVPAYDLPYLVNQIKELVEANVSTEAVHT